jgi:hypothetical protein
MHKAKRSKPPKHPKPIWSGGKFSKTDWKAKLVPDATFPYTVDNWREVDKGWADDDVTINIRVGQDGVVFCSDTHCTDPVLVKRLRRARSTAHSNMPVLIFMRRRA